MKKLMKIFLISMVIVYGWSLFAYFNAPLITELVTHGSHKEMESTIGYIVRNEIIVYSGAQGSISPVAQEGERVPKDIQIATVYTGEVDANVRQMIKELDSRIASIRTSQSNNDLFEGDLRKLDRQMNERVEELKGMQESKLLNLSLLKTEINDIIGKRLLISGEKGVAGANLQSLLDEKKAYERKLSASKIDLYSPVSGIISYEIDGLEEVLVPSNLSELDPGDFDFLEDYDFDEAYSKISNKGFPAAKIIDNFGWYIAAQVPETSLYSLAVGDNVSVCFFDYDDTTITASINHISNAQRGNVIIVLLLNQYIEDFYSNRKMNIGIISNSYSGLKIPASAIRVQDGKTGVFAVRNRMAKFFEVEVLSQSGNFAIIKEDNLGDGVLLYDEIILKSDNIQDGQLIR
jgi:putative membrane fusion protein